MTNLGVMLLDGRGVPKDEVAAATWFRKAAEAGNVDAMKNFAHMLSEGIGVKKDEAAASDWRDQAEFKLHFDRLQ